jgi:hypothetical protein
MKGMEFGRPWQAKEAVPGLRTEPHDAGKTTIEAAKTNCAQKRRKIGAKGKNRCPVFVSGIDCDHKKNRDLCEWRRNELGES